MDVTGTPCQDFSPLGSRHGHLGPQMHIFVAWVKLVLSMSVLFLVHENVPQFPEVLLHMFLGHQYHIFSIIMDCHDLGFSMTSRRRRYTILFHKSRTCVIANPALLYQELTTALASDAPAAISACWLADALEVLQEIVPLCAARQVSVDLAMADMQCLLTVPEQERLAQYSAMWYTRFHIPACQDVRAVFNLADNPAAGFVTWSASSGRLPAMRTNSGKLWVPYLGRWLTVRERLAAMGAPVFFTFGTDCWCPCHQPAFWPCCCHHAWQHDACCICWSCHVVGTIQLSGHQVTSLVRPKTTRETKTLLICVL